MNSDSAKLSAFVAYVHKHLKGHERPEAQIFCDRLFQAFGHAGAIEAGGAFEAALRYGKRTKFLDLLWSPRVLLEMKTRGEKLENHYRQAFEYWLHLVPHRPSYVILCNFDEFWVYDLNRQLDEPMDRIRLDELPARYTALNFLFPKQEDPVFKNNWVEVTEVAARRIGAVFSSLVDRGEDRMQAQRFVLQCVVSLFSEDIDLLPRDLFTKLIADCQRGASSYDLLGELFRQMNNPKQARAGRFCQVPYFNGGLFALIDPIELNKEELVLLAEATSQNWSKVKPSIFGNMFEGTMDATERHSFGGHYTSEADIQQVVLPTVIRPWRQRLEQAKGVKDLVELREDLLKFRVLDPACGSGNFLYVAYRELKRVEMDLLDKLSAAAGKKKIEGMASSLVSAKQFFGIDINHFAVDLAKVTLMLGKKLAIDEARQRLEATQQELPFEAEKPIPLENLDQTIKRGDALFCEWPKVDAIIGNPPFQSKNKLQQILEPKEIGRIRDKYPGVPGRADYCVYWFRRAHDELPVNGSAGLVGTNTIRENYSREGGLDYIVSHGGTITEAVSSQPWSGDAVVHVSIVNWIKGDSLGDKKLVVVKEGRSGEPLEREVFLQKKINSSLSPRTDVSGAKRLATNATSKACYQGQTHGHEGFLLQPDEAAAMLSSSSKNSDVIFPFLTADEMIGEKTSQPTRYVIDFSGRDLLAAKAYELPFAKIEKLVLPTRKEAARNEKNRNAAALEANPKAKVNSHHANFLKTWWRLSYSRDAMMKAMERLSRYIACGRVTKRPIFEFLETGIHPNDALAVFPLSDDYSFGILQSGIHWAWFVARCSTLKGDFRYTSDTVFDTFPWPQMATAGEVGVVARAGIKLRNLRRQVMKDNNWSLRELYRTLELPGANPLREAQTELDSAVKRAYKMPESADVLGFLLELNATLADREARTLHVVPPGLPPVIDDPAPYISTDCVQSPAAPVPKPKRKAAKSVMPQPEERRRPG